MATAHPAVQSTASPSLANDLYRAIWRRHFYAGLFVIPFMMLLAITGGLYLFDDEIDGLVYGDRLYVEPTSTERVPPSTQLAAAIEAHPGAVLKDYVAPAAADRSSVFQLATADGGSIQAYVDPNSGRYLGSAAGGDNGRNTWLMQLIVLDAIRGHYGHAGTSALITLHDLAMAAHHCRRMICLHDRRIDADGSPGEVLTAERLRRIYRIDAMVERAASRRLHVTPLSAS